MDNRPAIVETESAAPATAPVRRGLGLSWKLLILTVAFAMVSAVLIYVPRIANYRMTWLADRLAMADTAAVVKSQLEQLGFKVNFQKVTHDIMYTKFCSTPSNAPDVCPNVGWLKDFNDGQSILEMDVRRTAGWPCGDFRQRQVMGRRQPDRTTRDQILEKGVRTDLAVV